MDGGGTDGDADDEGEDLTHPMDSYSGYSGAGNVLLTEQYTFMPFARFNPCQPCCGPQCVVDNPRYYLWLRLFNGDTRINQTVFDAPVVLGPHPTEPGFFVPLTADDIATARFYLSFFGFCDPPGFGGEVFVDSETVSVVFSPCLDHDGIGLFADGLLRRTDPERSTYAHTQWFSYETGYRSSRTRLFLPLGSCSGFPPLYAAAAELGGSGPNGIRWASGMMNRTYRPSGGSYSEACCSPTDDVDFPPFHTIPRGLFYYLQIQNTNQSPDPFWPPT